MKKIPNVHITLFVLTFLTTLITGAGYSDANIFEKPWEIYKGLPFSLSLMAILLSHEFSHFYASKRHHTEATLPYFLPAPPFISPIGTFGAYIQMKSPIITRKALIDIGASGPVAGFILSVVASVVGLKYSTVVSAPPSDGVIGLGDSILFSFLTRLVIGDIPESHEILLHPVAFAGWIGLFVTSLNLIPIGQLDGGHIAFAFFRKMHKLLSRLLVGVLLVMGFVAILQLSDNILKTQIPYRLNIFVKKLPDLWAGWALWGVLMMVLGIKHPPVIYWEIPLDWKRRFIGALAFIIFIITFMPSPFKI